jgi:glycosyltransferase involved in cell wall biosynthesis
MKIAFLNSIEKETYGGMEEWIRLVSAGLIARGHRVSLLGRVGSRFLDRVRRSIPDARYLPLNISGDFDPVIICKIRRHLSVEGVNVLCVNFNKDVRLGGIAARFTSNVKVVWSLGMNITKENLVHRILTPRLIDGVITPSQSLKEEVTRGGYISPDMVHVIPNGTRLNDSSLTADEARRRLREKYNLPAQAIIAVNSGRFVNHKGHAFLIEAAPAVVSKYPDIIFLLLGEGYLQEQLQQRVSKLNLDKHFVFAGMLDDLRLELAGSDLMVHPSLIEPFGISLIEGMQAGLPIIATSVGGIPEVVGDCGCAVLVEPGHIGQLSTAVIGLLGAPERMQAMGKAARKRWSKEFTIDIMLGRVEQYLSGFLN